MYYLNNEIINSSLFKNFLKINENNNLFKNYIKEPNHKNKVLLDQGFQHHSKKALAISYLKKIIYYESRRFDINVRKLVQNQPLIIDNCDTALIDMIKDDQAEEQFQYIEGKCIESFVSDDLLLQAIHNLSDRQQKILYFYYALDLNDADIAAKYNISQQAISKSRKQAILKLKKLYS